MPCSQVSASPRGPPLGEVMVQPPQVAPVPWLEQFQRKSGLHQPSHGNICIYIFMHMYRYILWNQHCRFAMHIIFISLEIQRVRVTAYHSLAAGWLCEPVVEGEDSLCLVPYLRCLVRRYDRGRLDVVQSTGGKEQHSAAVQLGKGVRDTIQVFQGPLPVLNW